MYSTEWQESRYPPGHNNSIGHGIARLSHSLLLPTEETHKNNENKRPSVLISSLGGTCPLCVHQQQVTDASLESHDGVQREPGCIIVRGATEQQEVSKVFAVAKKGLEHAAQT